MNLEQIRTPMTSQDHMIDTHYKINNIHYTCNDISFIKDSRR